MSLFVPDINDSRPLDSSNGFSSEDFRMSVNEEIAEVVQDASKNEEEKKMENTTVQVVTTIGHSAPSSPCVSRKTPQTPQGYYYEQSYTF